MPNWDEWVGMRWMTGEGRGIAGPHHIAEIGKTLPLMNGDDTYQNSSNWQMANGKSRNFTAD